MNKERGNVRSSNWLAPGSVAAVGPPAKMPTRREMKAFELGEAAHGRGATLDDNPYPKYDANRLPNNLHCMWMCGWTSGKCDSPKNP